MPKSPIDSLRSVLLLGVLAGGCVLLMVALSQLTRSFAVDPEENPTLVFKVQQGNSTIGSTNSSGGAGGTLYYAVNDTITLDAYVDCSGGASNWTVEIDNDGTGSSAGSGPGQFLTNTTLNATGSWTVESHADQGNSTLGPISGTIWVMDVAAAKAQNASGGMQAGTVYRALPSSGTLSVPIQAYLTDGASTEITDEAQKPYTFAWNLTSSPTNSTADIAESDKLGTNLSGIDAVGNYTIRARPGDAGTTQDVTLRMVKVDLEFEGIAEDEEEVDGGWVAVNSGFDEGNEDFSGSPVEDYEPDAATGHRMVADDDELATAVLLLDYPAMTGKWKLIFPSNIKVWKDNGDGTCTELTSGAESAQVALPQTVNLRVEGIAWAPVNAVELKAAFTPTGQTVPIEDAVLLTVVAPDFTFCSSCTLHVPPKIALDYHEHYLSVDLDVPKKLQGTPVNWCIKQPLLGDAGDGRYRDWLGPHDEQNDNTDDEAWTSVLQQVLPNTSSGTLQAGFRPIDDGVFCVQLKTPGGRSLCKKRSRILRVLLEPVNTASSPAENPCAVVVDQTAQYSITVDPTSTVDNADIHWSVASGSVSFSGGDTGRTVAVKGDAVGEAKLDVQIDDVSIGVAPTIELEVVDKKTVDVYAYVVAENDGTNPATTNATINSYIATVNDIYRQVGMEFQIKNGIQMIKKYEWLTIDNTAEFDALCEYAKNTGGVEVYFTNILICGAFSVEGLHSAPNDPPPGLAKEGLALSDKGNGLHLAHELGHACRLPDHYIIIGSDGLAKVKEDWAPKDWNGGHGPPYYPMALTQNQMIDRLLMQSGGSGWDVPKGRIHSKTTLTGEPGLSKAGLQDMDRTPTHW